MQCPKCNGTDFYLYSDGRTRCRTCKNAKTKEWREKNDNFSQWSPERKQAQKERKQALAKAKSTGKVYINQFTPNRESLPCTACGGHNFRQKKVNRKGRKPSVIRDCIDCNNARNKAYYQNKIKLDSELMAQRAEYHRQYRSNPEVYAKMCRQALDRDKEQSQQLTPFYVKGLIVRGINQSFPHLKLKRSDLTITPEDLQTYTNYLTLKRINNG